MSKTGSVRLGQRTYSSRSLHGQVVHELGKRIVSGTIAEGQVLPNETELGAEFKVSRTALREGIKVLTAKGLLASRTRTGTRVRPRNEWNMLDPDILAWRLDVGVINGFVRDLFEFRKAVEPVAASLAALRAKPEDMDRLNQAYKDMVNADESAEPDIEIDLRFHQAILGACGNELMAPMSSLIETALTYCVDMASPEHRRASVPEHKTVLDAIASGDAEGAHAAMSDLLQMSIDRHLALQTSGG
ncbi:FadR/GntR family transcriptional regulator [Pseudomonadota bacterium]